MKRIIKMMMVLLVAGGLVACGESKPTPEQVYYALTSQVNYYNTSTTLYETDKAKVDATIAELNDLLTKISEIELKNEEQQEIQKDFLAKADEYLKHVAAAQKAIQQSNVKEANGDYSLLDKSNKALDDYNDAESALYDVYAKFTYEREETDRIKAMDAYFDEAENATDEVYAAKDYRHSLVMKSTNATAAELKELTKKIATAQAKIDALKSITVDEKDQELKDKKEAALKTFLDTVSKSQKNINDTNVRASNVWTQKLNVLASDIYAVNLYYKIDVEPYLPTEE